MISERTKIILVDFIKDGITSFDLDMNNIGRVLRQALNNDVSDLQTSIIEAFNNGYIYTHDNKLEDKNFTKNSLKLLFVNIDKIFHDNILVGFEEYNELFTWHTESKDEINWFNNISSFIKHLETDGYKDISFVIMDCIERINEALIIEGKPNEKLTCFGIWYTTMWRALDNLPSSYNHEKEYFALNKYYKLAEKQNSNMFSDVSRNDICLCGSGKKFKKCCMIK